MRRLAFLILVGLGFVLALASEFNATVNADLRVGALEETITVTGESPIVDVQVPDDSARSTASSCIRSVRPK